LCENNEPPLQRLTVNAVKGNNSRRRAILVCDVVWTGGNGPEYVFEELATPSRILHGSRFIRNKTFLPDYTVSVTEVFIFTL
jgi:hypothetical protein